MYRLSEIQQEIRKYKLKEILISGENDMFDNKIDRKAVEQCLNEETENLIESENKKFDLNKTLLDIDEVKLFESIINLKNNNVGWNFKLSNKKWTVGSFVFRTFYFCY